MILIRTNIRINLYQENDTNEYANIFVSKRSIRTNVQMNICDKYIWIYPSHPGSASIFFSSKRTRRSRNGSVTGEECWCQMVNKPFAQPIPKQSTYLFSKKKFSNVSFFRVLIWKHEVLILKLWTLKQTIPSHSPKNLRENSLCWFEYVAKYFCMFHLFLDASLWTLIWLHFLRTTSKFWLHWMYKYSHMFC